MSEDSGQQNRENKANYRVTKFSRRQFLKRMGIAAGGAAIASISLASGCKSSSSTTPLTTTNDNTTSPTTSGTTVPSSTTPSSSTPPPMSTTTTTTIPTSSTPVTTGSSYVPPTVLPPLINVPNTECEVATDRLYSVDHLWVKSVSANIVVVGISAILEKILGEPFKISDTAVGSTLAQGDTFVTIEGFKIAADLPSPVSGTIVQVNAFLKGWMLQGQIIQPLVIDVYNTGWVLAIQLSKPDELKALLTAQQYRDLASKK